MDYSNKSCPNPECPDYQKYGQGNIVFNDWIGKDKTIARLRCTTWKTNFSEHKGTLFEQSRLPCEQVLRIYKCLVHGNSIEATADICEVTSKSVSRIVTIAGEHHRAVHDFLVQDLKGSECQLEEFWSFVKKKRRIAPQRNEKKQGINGDM